MSSTTDPGNKSSAQIEREVEGTRARLTNTIEELRDRVSPGQMMEEAVSYFRGSGGNEMVQNLGRQLRDNPMPALLIGAGIAWMMLGSRSSANAYTSPSSTTYSQPPRPLSGTTPHGPETRHLAGAPAYVPAGSTATSSYTSSSSTSSGAGAWRSGDGRDARCARRRLLRRERPLRACLRRGGPRGRGGECRLGKCDGCGRLGTGTHVRCPDACIGRGLLPIPRAA